ncbi:hypothetical protein C6P45_002706 [Maudiozyma exigua]|uniref:Transcription activator GCR1-like domain-containing protein n=1 Tax=Maudiozyma exigua TaxID=34358 RepID=A0A9P7BAP5_MAUEX|nr:hypothetical protein C6P45_002706 [Kazachstania exigua]
MAHSDTSEKPLHERVEEIERKIVLFEDLFHAFSSRLDKHFEKYDKLIHSQQKQIVELNSIVGTMLNDQAKHSDHLRNKLMNSINDINNRSSNKNSHRQGVSYSSSSSSLSTNVNNNKAMKANSLPAHVNGTTIPQLISDPGNTNSHAHDHTTSGNAGIPQSDDIFNDLIDGHSSANDAANVVIPVPKTVYGRKRRHASNNIQENDNFGNTLITDPKDLMDKHNIHNSLSDVYKPANGTFQHTSADDDMSSSSDHLQNTLSNVSANVNSTSKNIGTVSTQKKRKYEPATDEPFKFLKCPQSVLEVWKEYTDGIEGQPSIKEMETLYQATWRRDSATNKRYARRKPLWKSIEIGLTRGYTLEYIVEMLENTRYVDDTKQTKHPIGWILQSTNIPDFLK